MTTWKLLALWTLGALVALVMMGIAVCLVATWPLPTETRPVDLVAAATEMGR